MFYVVIHFHNHSMYAGMEASTGLPANGQYILWWGSDFFDYFNTDYGIWELSGWKTKKLASMPRVVWMYLRITKRRYKKQNYFTKWSHSAYDIKLSRI